jgi:hypothetical protein
VVDDVRNEFFGTGGLGRSADGREALLTGAALIRLTCKTEVTQRAWPVRTLHPRRSR